MQLGGREGLLSASCLTRQTQTVLAAPADDERARNIGRRAILLGSSRKIAHEGVESFRGGQALQFACNDLSVETPGSC